MKRQKTGPSNDSGGICHDGLGPPTRGEPLLRGFELENELIRIVDALPGLIWTVLPSGSVDFVNRRWRDFTGLTVEEAGGSGWQTAVHPDDIGQILAALRLIPESGETRESTVRLRRSDGTYRWVIFQFAPFLDASGVFVKWCGTATDIDPLATDERNLTQMLRTFPTTAWSTEPDGFCDFLNHRWLDYSGLTAEQARGWGWAVVIHPDDVDALTEHWKSRLETGMPVDTEARMRGRDGTYRWFLFRANPLRDECGTIIKWYGTNIDIEDRKQAEEELKAKERDLFQTINTIPSPAFSTHADGHVDFLNQRWLDYAGMTAEQALGWGWKTVIHPDDVDRHLQYWQSCLESGTEGEIEARHRRFDGVYRWCVVRANPLRDESGNVIKWYGISFDIEDRKRAEDALKLSRSLLEKGQSTSSTGSFFWRVDGNVVDVSDEFRRIHEFEPDVPITLDQIRSRIHPEDLAMIGDKIERAREGGDDLTGVLDYDVRLVMPDGSIKFVHTNGHGTRDPSGVLEIIGATQDITSRRLAEYALIEARTELERVARVTALGALTASIAHEVSQPLSVVGVNAGMCLRLLTEDPPNVSAAIEAAQGIVADGKRASDVIAHLRSFFAKRGGMTEMIDLNSVAREVVAFSSIAIQRNRVVLREELAGDLPQVMGDRVELQQVIMNLLLNACDAMRDVEGRTREVFLRSERDDGGRVRLSLQDTGVGIEPQSEHMLFEPFYTTKDGGMGIGLSISRSIVERHGGRLWATPNEGHGATFAFVLPARTI